MCDLARTVAQRERAEIDPGLEELLPACAERAKGKKA